MDLSSASLALSSIKTVYDIAIGANSLKTSTEVQLAISDMLGKLTEAKKQIYEAMDNEQSLSSRIKELEDEISRIKQRFVDLENYEPKLFYPGVTVYMAKTSSDANMAQQKLCEYCYSKGEKSLLNPTAKQEGKYRQHICPSCRTEYFLGGEIPTGAPVEPERIEPTIDHGESSWVSSRRRGPNSWMG